MKAYAHLIRYALANGATVSVYDGEEWQENRSKDAAACIAAVESVEEAEIVIRDTDSKERRMAWARVAAYGLADDETVVDYTVNDFMNAWQAAYDAAESVSATLDTADLQRAAQTLRAGSFGGFAAAIGDAATRADSHNLKRLAAAFPELFAAAQTTTA
jgi:hypothetical protein